MTFDDYVDDSKPRCARLNPSLDAARPSARRSGRLAEEAAEVLGLVRKQACSRRATSMRDRFVEELGDVLWCLVASTARLTRHSRCSARVAERAIRQKLGERRDIRTEFEARSPRRRTIRARASRTLASSRPRQARCADASRPSARRSPCSTSAPARPSSPDRSSAPPDSPPSPPRRIRVAISLSFPGYVVTSPAA